MSFTTSQIYYLEFALDLLRRVFKEIALNSKSKETVRATRSVVHFMGTHNFILLSFFPPFQSLLSRPALSLKHIFDSELLEFVPSHLQRLTFIGVDKVENRFVINLNKGNKNFKAFV